MAHSTRQRWINLATILLALVAALIRPPVIDGSMVDQLSGTNERLEIARRISTAAGDTSTIAVIVSPADVTIAETFADLAALRRRLTDLDNGITIRSIDAASDQLFLYRLAGADPVAELLVSLRDNRQSATIINANATSFLIVITSPGSFDLGVLDILDSHAWDDLYVAHAVLASAQLERDVAAGLEKDLRLLIPVIVGITLIALFVAFGHWRALMLPLFASAASTVVTFALFSVAGVTINLVTLLALPIVLVVGLANSCHFLAKSGSDSGSRDDIGVAVRLTLQRVGLQHPYNRICACFARL